MRTLLPDRVTAWSLLSGLLLSAAFPRPDFAAAAWFALVPLLLVMNRHPFRSGFATGVGFFGPVLYWLNIVMTTYGMMHPLLSVVAYMLLVAYLSLFFGAATWACCRLQEKLSLAPALTLPVLWVGLEFLRSFLFSGFPWASLAYSQQSHLPMIQSADLLGVYGLGYLIVLVNTLLAKSLLSLGARPRHPFPRGLCAVTLTLFALNLSYGYWCLARHPDRRDNTLRVGLAQGNIDQSLKWNPAMQMATVERYRTLSSEATKAGAQLLIWPESATPFYYQDGGQLAELVRQAARDSGGLLLFGSPAYEVVNRLPRYLNSAFLLSDGGDLLGRSDKVHLVPFGEYVPLGRFLPFIEKLAVGIGDFSPGSISPLPMDGHKIGVLICYEAIFPELAREWVRQGSDLLVNITNDAWFGHSSAPYQHLAMTRFRAVENRIWLARAANTGISALIAPSGRIVAQSPIFETLQLTGEVGLGARPSLYTRFGDVLPVTCLLLSVLWLLRTRRRFTGD